MRTMSFFMLFIPSSLAAANTIEPASSIALAHTPRMLEGLMFVLLLIFILSWAVKRLNLVQLASDNGFKTIATMSLGPKEKVILVQVGSRYLLLGAGASITLLHDFGEEMPKGLASLEKPSLAAIFKKALWKQTP